jgi:hypothetical protein
MRRKGRKARRKRLNDCPCALSVLSALRGAFHSCRFVGISCRFVLLRSPSGMSKSATPTTTGPTAGRFQRRRPAIAPAVQVRHSWRRKTSASNSARRRHFHNACREMPSSSATSRGARPQARSRAAASCRDESVATCVARADRGGGFVFSDARFCCMASTGVNGCKPASTAVAPEAGGVVGVGVGRL